MRRLRNLFSRKNTNQELSEEIEQHIADRTAALIEQGLDPAAAASAARRGFGNTTLARERSVEVWQWRWLENLWADLRYALHQLTKSPGYALTAILTLAIGIGANAAIFSVIDDIMLRSLPVPYPQQLVELGYRSPASQEFLNGQSVNGLAYLARSTRSVAGVAGWNGSMLFVPDDQGTLRSIAGSLVTGNAMAVLGLHPYLGRLLTPADDAVGGPEGGWPVVLDYGFWAANYRGDPGAIGRHVTISAHDAVIVGVLPRDFYGLSVGNPTKVYMPMHFWSVLATAGADPYAHPDRPSMLAVGRLRPGVPLSRLNAELAAASPAFKKAFLPPAAQSSRVMGPATLAAQSARRGFSDFLSRQYGQPLLLLQGIVLLVLLLCCVNLAGLQLARVQARQHEFAVRAALGAGRGRILQQCLTESLLLAGIGSLLAAGYAWSSTAALGAFLTPAGSGDATRLSPDARVLWITTALAVVTTLLFGFLPAWIAGRTSPGLLLKSKGVQQRGSALRRRIFMPAQFALALVLVLGAGLFSQTLLRLRDGNTGFDAAHIVEVCAQFQTLKKTPAELAALYHAMTDSLRNAPGVEAATYTWVTPLTDFAPRIHVHATARAHEDHLIAFNEVGDGYFATLGTRLVAGREFSETDNDNSVCIVNQAAARMLLPGDSALGATLRANGTDDAGDNVRMDATCRVVGLAEDAHYANLRDPAPPTVYFPIIAASMGEGGYTSNMVFMIRAHTDAEAIAAYRPTLARYAPTTGVMTFLPLRDQVAQSLGSERLIAMLTGIFAGIALLLSAIGIFGLLALRVEERTPEIGVRIAVGATRAHLLRMILGEALRMAAVGSVCGLALAALGYMLVRRFLYGASAADLSIAAAALCVLIAVALLAAAIPARRAASLDAVRALRAE